MLDLAMNHISDLQKEFSQAMQKERYRFYFRTPTINYFIPISETSDKIQMVSLDGEKVIGYLSARINRLTKTGYDIEGVNFLNKQSSVFTKDMYDFFARLYFSFGLNRLVWSVVVGNPAESFFDSITTLGARIVGVFKQDVMLPDGELYDLKYYEFLKDAFYKHMTCAGITGKTYRTIAKEVKGNEQLIR